MLPSDLALRCSGLSFGYGNGSTVLKGVSLDLRWGTLVAMFGHSGAGKTTLLRCLGGYSTPTGGTVEHNTRSVAPVFSPSVVAGNPIASRATALLELLKDTSTSGPNHPKGNLFGRRSSTWMMFADERNLLPHLTVNENLDLLLAPATSDVNLRERIILMVLEMFGLSHVAEHLPEQLSTGQIRRVQLGQSLLGSFDVLLLDEPTSGLDARTKYDLLELFQRLHASVPMTGLVVSHDIECCLLVADRILLFGDGEVVGQLDVPREGIRMPEDLDSGVFKNLRHEMLHFLRSPIRNTAA